MTAWPRWATSSERVMSFSRLLVARAGFGLSLLLVLSLHACGSGALHRATEERHEYPAGVVQMRRATRSPRNVLPALWSIRVSSWARARARWQPWTQAMAA